MAAQKRTKNLLTEIFGVFEHLLPQNSLDSSRPWERLLENPKTGGSRKLFLPENDFKSCSAVNSTKWLKTEFFGF